jgi:hypothetical protein
MCEDVGWVDKLDRKILLAKAAGDKELLARTEAVLFGERRVFADLILLETGASGVGSEFVIGHPTYYRRTVLAIYAPYDLGRTLPLDLH